AQHPLIKTLHQLGRRRVVDLPQTRHHALRPRVQKGSRQPQHAFAADLFAQTSAASAEHDQVGGELEVGNIHGAQKAVQLLALPIYQREDEAGKFRVRVVEQAMGGEMDVAVRL